MFARIRKEEEGSSTVEFVLYFTVFFFLLSAGIEMAYMNLRHAMLERGVDLATRDIRLSSGNIPSYSEVRA
jgi:Flp pilus assembly protein TadG